jgi:hypothetical protein
MRSRIFVFVVLAAALAAIAVGVGLVGGPLAARRDKFDQNRIENLYKIASSLLCGNPRIKDPVLPQDLTLETLRTYCSGVSATPELLIDGETGKPYVYKRKSDKEFSICAVFYDAPKAVKSTWWRDHANLSFDPETGCVSGRIR